jgi:hypothetical protein
VTLTGHARFELSSTRRRALRDGLIVAGLIFNAVFVIVWLPRMDMWIDAQAWWKINLNDLYGPGGDSLEYIGAFRYAPAVAWLFAPAAWLTWEQLVAAYLALSAVALWLLTGRRALLFLIAFPPVLLELINGNIHLFMALAIWIGMRWPAAWAFLLLTKVTPGVGVLWFAVRGEWRRFAVGLGTTMAVVAAGFVIAPAQWLAWIEFLTSATTLPQIGTLPPLAVRLSLAALVVAFAARTDRAWLLPVASVLAMPTIWLQSTAVLLASFPLYWERDRFRSRAGAEPATAPGPSVVRPAESGGRA